MEAGRTLKALGIALDVLVLTAAVGVAYMKVNSHSYYSGDVRSGQSAAYIANFYRERGYSLRGSLLGVHMNGTVINSSGLVLDSARATLYFSAGRDVLLVYSSDQKVRDPLPQEVDPLRLSLRVDRDVDRLLVSLDPLWTEGLRDLADRVGEVVEAVGSGGVGYQAFVSFKLQGGGLAEAIRGNRVPIYWLQEDVNEECTGLFMFVGSTVAPFYLVVENMNWRDLARLDAILRRWVPEEAWDMFAYDIRVKIVFDRPPTAGEKAAIYGAVSTLQGVRFAKFAVEFKG